MASNKNKTSNKKKNTSRKSNPRKPTANTKAKKSEKKAATKMENPSERPDFLVDVYLILFIAVTVLLFIGNLGLGGVIGNTICGFFFGLFGVVNYLVPAAMVLGVFYYISNRNSAYALRKLIYAGMFAWFLMMLTELFVHGQDSVGAGFAFMYSREHHLGGGFFGGIFADFFTTAFGTIGAYVIDVLALLLFFILMSERSGVKKIQKQKKKYEAMMEQREKEGPNLLIENPKRIREEHPEVARDTFKKAPGRQKVEVRESKITRNGEEEGLRRDRRIQGVTLDTQIHSDLASPIQGDFENGDEISEVQLGIPGQPLEVSTVDRYKLHADGTEENTSTSPRIHSSMDSSRGELPSTPSSNPVRESVPVRASEPTEVKPSRPVVPAPGPVIEPEIHSEYTETGIHKPATTMGSSLSKRTTATETTDHAQDVDTPYIYPSVELLNKVKNKGRENDRFLHETAQKLQETLKNFGINVQITDISCGPAVTRYELQPEMGVKVSRIVNLQDDIKMNLAATDIRIEAPIPGKAAIGIEVPNKEASMVAFRDVVESPDFQNAKSNIAFAVGRDIAGKVVVSDIAKMPHLLIAGATGSGKSVCINTIIMSILYRAKPDEVKFIMIDPKVVELSVYNGIPHLLIPVVTDPKKASAALQWAVNEMTLRYKKFADTHVRDMKGYNSRIKNGKMTVYDENGDEQMIDAEKMPQLVVIVDELADLMMVAAKEVEESITRLAQLARAAGIHLIVATQRPSVNVITGLIKANMPSRIAFSVTSGVDSRTILDMVGAEKLLGKGDMLYFPQGLTKPIRVQGCFVSDEEVGRVVKFLKDNNAHKGYDPQIQEEMNKTEQDGYLSIDGNGGGFTNDRDEYFADAARLVIEKEKGSIGMLQRNFKIGFNRAARIMDQLEDFGVVGPEEGTKPRRILLTIEEFERLLSEEGV